MIAFSVYFSFLVPAGVGLYWIFGNLLAVPSMIILNKLIPPKKYVDYDYLLKMKEQRRIQDNLHKNNLHKERSYYKAFCKCDNMRLVFYAEQKGFYKYFAPIIERITSSSDLTIHYVTSDPNDDILEDHHKNVVTYYIASDKYLIPMFMKLDCDICVMTTPDLEKYHIKRSRVRKDIEYIYMSHGMGSVNLTLRKGALNWFDTVFCTGPDIADEIRAIEKLYGIKQKRLVETGYALIDDMVEKYNNSEHTENKRKKILIAPSW